jgi:hypothetical protein
MPEQRDNTALIVAGVIGAVGVATVAGIAIYNAMQDDEDGGDADEPAIVVSPASAKVGQIVNISGVEFPPSATIQLTMGSVVLQSATTDAAGDFSVNREVPASLSPGNVIIVATSGTASAQASFQVLPTNGGAGPHISGITFDQSSRRKTAEGSDNWPVTWADDNHQYTSWGDGEGLQGDDRRSLGFGRLEGDYPNWTGRDLSFGSGKCLGILCVHGELYAFVTPGSNEDGFNSYSLWHSEDHAQSWDTLYTFQRTEDGGPPLVKPGFLQFGRDYANAKDNFVYAYLTENTVTTGERITLQKPGRVHLLRCPISGLSSKSNWQAFTSTNPASPTWGRLRDSKPVFRDEARGVGRTASVIYHATLERYILCAEYGQSRVGQFQFHDAPEPWGPWQKIADVNFPTTSFYGNFSQKWMSGNDFVFIYCGSEGQGLGQDALTTIEGRFVP